MKPFVLPMCILLTTFLMAEHQDPKPWLSTPQQRQERIDEYDQRKARHLPSEKYGTDLSRPPRPLTPPADPLCRKVCREKPYAEACQDCRDD